MNNDFIVTEKEIANFNVCGYRMKAKYEEMGIGFQKLAPAVGNDIAGPSFALYYDKGFVELADYEVAFPVNTIKNISEFSSRKLDGGKCVSCIYKGSYENAAKAWESAFQYLFSKGYKPLLPSREIYLVSPHDTNNASEYVTEIQIFVE